MMLALLLSLQLTYTYSVITPEPPSKSCLLHFTSADNKFDGIVTVKLFDTRLSVELSKDGRNYRGEFDSKGTTFRRNRNEDIFDKIQNLKAELNSKDMILEGVGFAISLQEIILDGAEKQVAELGRVVHDDHMKIQELIKKIDELSKELEKLKQKSDDDPILKQRSEINKLFPTLLGSWKNYGSPWDGAYYFKSNGIVYLNGLVKDGTDAIFKLLEGYRPSGQLLFGTDGVNSHARVDVYPNGQVIYTTGSNAHVSLSGISFLAEN